VFLLEIDEPTMLARLDARQDNEWGRAGDSRGYIRRLLLEYQNRLRALLCCCTGHKEATREDRNWPVTWVGVAGFEPAASSSRTEPEC
jgi:hypothetical protein